MPKASPKKPAIWKHREGTRGCVAWAQELTPGGPLYIRWRDKTAKNWRWQCLHHTDRDAAIREAQDTSHNLRTGRQAALTGKYTLQHIFGLYRASVTPHKKNTGPQQDRRRMDLWERYLGADCDPLSITPQRVKDYLRDRKAGKIRPTPTLNARGKIVGRKSEGKISATTAGNDVRFLKAVLRWASGEGLIERNPIADVPAPRNVNPKQPVATMDRFERVRPHCTGLFGPFLSLVEALGWRVTALRSIRASDLDLSARPASPHGRILKRAESDKRGVEMWVPLSPDARAAVDEALRLSGVAGEAFVFTTTGGEKPWSQKWAWDQLQRSEKVAGVEHLEHGAFHPYRRKWVRERNHLPRADVAAAGGWLSVQTLAIYDGASEDTLLAVVSEPRKLREVK